MIRRVNDRNNELSEVCEAIVDHFVRRLRASVHRNCNGTSLASLVDDIVQESFSRFWQQLRDGRMGPLTLGNWKDRLTLDMIEKRLFGIARNVRFEFYRRFPRHETIHDQATVRAPATSCPVVLSEIQAAIQKCKPAHQETFLLKQEGWSTADIATKQGVAAPTVRTNYSRARRDLREILKDYDDTSSTVPLD